MGSETKGFLATSSLWGVDSSGLAAQRVLLSTGFTITT